ncbi:F-box/WD-40 repeat-containing protein 1 [Cardamine amara subsp. amara]|uniref:F-box/WD-40 repeat-containing protein 1 n=1 Tax=Cardamine amara subsp. amara TaxID=228776 RepID=A0ABD1A154_CARAN
MINFYGIGYDNASRDDYKILRFYNGEFEDEMGNMESHNPEVDIYEFKSSSWRTLDASSLDWFVVYQCKGVSVKGNMYWIAERNHSSHNFIQCFNFSIETFKPICSIPINYGVFDVVALSSYKGDKLSLLYQHEDKVDMEVWITKKVNANVVSWTKLFIFTRPDHSKFLTHEELAHPVYFIDNNNRIVICCDELVEDGHQVSVMDSKSKLR